MITADPAAREERLSKVVEIVRRSASEEDRELLCSFAEIAFGETPDRIALRLPVEAVAERIISHFRFVAKVMPPSTQLYKGLPGIHVSVRRPRETEAAAIGGGRGLPLETVIIETHTPDVPFIFDSIKNYLAKAGLRIFCAIHPIFTVHRQWERIVRIGGPHDEGIREVYCNFQIEPLESGERLRRMEHEIFSILKGVFLAVEDFPEMLQETLELASRLRSHPDYPTDVESARAFLRWLAGENYIYLGMARYGFGPDGVPERFPDSVSGVFADEALLPVVFPGFMEGVESHIRPAQDDFRIIDLDYCTNAAAIYHLEPIEGIVVREWAQDGSLAGATLMLGRFARSALMQRADRIPLLTEKIGWIVRESGFIPSSHDYRELVATFNRLPMCELFYSDPASLKSIIEPVVFMLGDDEILVHCRTGNCYEALSIAYSRLRYSYDTEKNLLGALSDAFGPVSFHTSAQCGAANLLLAYFDSSKLERPIDAEAVRRIVRPLLETWEGRVAAALEAAFGEREGRRLFQSYVRQETRSGLYREVTSPEQVPEDVKRLEALTARLEIRLAGRSPETALLHIYSTHRLGLTQTLRTLQNLGLVVTEELRIPLVLPEGRKCFMYRLEVSATPVRTAALIQAGERFTEALRALDEERTTDDPLNGLILDAKLDWREVEVLRTFRNHLLQIRPSFTVETVNKVLLRNPAVAGALFRSFAARFDPSIAADREGQVTSAENAVQAALGSVRNLAEDEILRALDNMIRSALRTNFYQRPERPVFAIKVDSGKVEGMPSPRPVVEIYVHSRLLEGIHLRGGPVARGGIRWSDRHDDFRTEILGLMKTQMVKNSIIVPVGSKGGFVLKGDVPARPALDAFLVDRYREFISGLLDVTDNIVDGKVLHPPDVERRDGDDPYLVVAADKGTAHLSDTANGVSIQYGFWLGDAFASGGSHGYDHKKVGITARGAWESVKHHFRNLAIDVQKEPFSVCAIGDMAGDVFGNGMLQSRCTLLVAAFNHAHIFIDPDPDPVTSYAERERLFKMPRSTWRDYDTSLISPGGGIFDRAAKAIPLTPEICRLLEMEGGSASGEELIRRILTARVDLLYNGGIGTYVKASSEENVDVGDRANDRVRVDASKVRARVVAEGGNLGFTQKARIEYWEHGGLINTDALDNAGGVALSDHEVNIKILLDLLVKKGVIAGKEARNQLLAGMTDEVAALVLADIENQARAVTLDGQRSARRYEEFAAFVESLVAAGIVNRADESLPSQEELLAGARRADGLPRPLLAVLLGYAKMWAFQMLMQTGLPDHETAHPFLRSYFPRQLREGYADHFKEHVLRREITATAVVNHIINFGGVMLISRLIGDATAGIGDAVAAYLKAEHETGAPTLRSQILSAGLDAAAEQESLIEIEDMLESVTRGLLEGRQMDTSPQALRPIATRLGL